MYDKLLEELTAMNGNAKSLLEKYDNAGVKLDRKTNELLEQLALKQVQIINQVNLIGSIIIFPTSVIPNGFLECNGAELSRISFAKLFAEIGTTYGNGNGSTTFRIPDLRGEFIRGFDNNRGVDTGRKIGSSQTDDFKAHNHKFNGYSSSMIRQGGDGQFDFSGISYSAYVNDANYRDMDNTGGVETRPRNIAMMYCIKY